MNLGGKVKMKKWKFLTAAALTLMLAACGSDEESTTEETNGQAQTEQSTETTGTEVAQAPVYPMTVSSLSTNRETEEGKSITFEDVTLEAMPEKIVVFDYGFLDTLDALGTDADEEKAAYWTEKADAIEQASE